MSPHGDRTAILESKSPLLLALLLFALVLALGLPTLAYRPPVHDELYHLLAARGLLESGAPRIAEGLYTRGLPYTYLVAAMLGLGGEGLIAVRLPALLAGALIPPTLFLWIRRRVDTPTALTATGLLAVSPFLLEIAIFGRFYTLQALSFLLGTIAVVEGLERSQFRWDRLPWLGAGLLLLGFATWLQPVTLLGVAGLLLWGGLRFLSPRAMVVVLGIAVVGLLIMQTTELWQDLWRRYRTTPEFNARFANAVWFYHAWYQLYYPGFWSLTPLLAVLAFARAPRVALLALALVATVLALASFAAAKGLRYVAFIQPFLFLLWGLGLMELRNRLAPFLPRLWPTRIPFGPWQIPGKALGVLAVTAFLLLQPFWLRTAALTLNIRLPLEAQDPDWSQALAVLRPWAQRVAVVVTSEDVYALYYLGRHDIGFSVTKYRELAGQPPAPLRWDPRIGRPLAGDPAALAQILKCYPSGLFIAHEGDMDNPAFVPSAARAVLEREARPLPLPAGSGLVAYVWERQTSADPTPCDDLPPPSRRP